jgi:pilus assembly protein Flp/PilA
MTLIRKLIKNEKGATAIEYGLIAALVAVAAIAGMRAIGGAVNARFQNAASEMNSSN